MSELSVGTLSGLAANSYEVSIASGSTLDLANAKTGSLPESALAFTAGGLKHIHTESFTGVANISLDNVFSADYQNYRVVVTELQGSANVDLNFRLRVSGATTTGNYRFSNYGLRTQGSSFADWTNGGSPSFIRIGSVTVNAGQSKSSFDVFEPFAAKITGLTGGFFGGDATSYFGTQIGGAQTDSTSFDGFELYPTSGTVNGKVTVYGYVEA